MRKIKLTLSIPTLLGLNGEAKETTVELNINDSTENYQKILDQNESIIDWEFIDDFEEKPSPKTPADYMKLKEIFLENSDKFDPMDLKDILLFVKLYSGTLSEDSVKEVFQKWPTSKDDISSNPLPEDLVKDMLRAIARAESSKSLLEEFIVRLDNTPGGLSYVEFLTNMYKNGK